VQITQRDLHAQLREQSVATRDHLTTLLRPLNSAQINEHPEPRGWSIAEVLEHLCIAQESYEDRFTATVRSARPDAGAPARVWHPTFLKSMDDAASLDWNKVKMGTPVFPAWMPKLMNLGDAFRIHVVHVSRHARQIARLAGKLSS